MLLVRVVEPSFGDYGFEGTNAVVLELADAKEVSRMINSSQETGSFELPINDPKLKDIAYWKFWEMWDSETNERINYGPIHSIQKTGSDKIAISGPGRKQLLADINRNFQTFYYPLNRFIDDLRFENLAIEPRTKTIIDKTTSSPYYSLSKKTKDNAIDDLNIQFPLGADQPNQSFHRTADYWTGTDKADELILDLGQVAKISKESLQFPWWGGPQPFDNRAYDYELAYSTDNETYTTYYTVTNNTHPTGDSFAGSNTFYFAPVSGYEWINQHVYHTAIDARYFRVKITNTHAWYGNTLEDTVSDEWNWECGGQGTFHGQKSPMLDAKGVYKTINTRNITPPNDCHASIVEAGVWSTIMGRKKITSATLHQIDDTNRQITYTHTVDDSPGFNEITRKDGLVKYEPGGFFRNVRIQWSSAASSFTKFYSTDCDDCITSSHFAVEDNNNTLVYRSNSTSGTKQLRLPGYTSFIQMKGDADATIISSDAWRSKSSTISYGAGYSFTTHMNDTATLRFRGETLKWYITVPSGVTAGHVKLQLRNKDDDGLWTAFTTLEDDLELPINVNAEVVYEIKKQDNVLKEDTVYEFRITNINGGYVSIDSFGGYWTATYSEFNEDHERMTFNNRSYFTQIYDERYSRGTMYRSHIVKAHESFSFEGDRAIVYSAMGPNYGKLTLYLTKNEVGVGYGTNLFDIPDGSIASGFDNDVKVTAADGYIIANLDTGANGHEIPQFILFDSDEWFPAGMPWGQYTVHMRLLEKDTYAIRSTDIDAKNFAEPCTDCHNKPSTGKIVHVQKPIFIDGVGAHETSGVSAKFVNKSHLEILQSLVEALSLDWDVDDEGLYVVPRIGTDTEAVLKEGTDIILATDITEDSSNVASMLISNGSAIDGIPLFAIVEDRKNKNILKRTVQRVQDYSDISDFFALIGASRTELIRRRVPEERITMTAFLYKNSPIILGDSCYLLRTDGKQQRIRLTGYVRRESFAEGTTYEVEAQKWPTIP